MLVDDDAAVREITTYMLESMGYTVMSFPDCRDAIIFLQGSIKKDQKIAVIMLDLTIPGGMGCLEGLIELRKLDARVPVIAVSGYSDAPAIAAPAAFGFTASLAKPFTLAGLSALLSKSCGQKAL